MPTTAWILLTGYLATTRRLIGDRARRIHTGAGDAGSNTLELVIIVLGLIAVATLLVVAITAAVTRRVNQIN
ncbi:hypothetical protein [Cellulomonas sp. P24]|jgi:hypothetical protein|uniref:hypothetical protein n=1 Tax=Cellulomonas sp. P24 TaxID=2885206 RepID=UPI00216ACA8F|nr:hypothetical protein [Cellulomonas sp. P24]MCR6492109.1 hypothetical protein [Cellulomonas sp. P24]